MRSGKAGAVKTMLVCMALLLFAILAVLFFSAEQSSALGDLPVLETQQMEALSISGQTPRLRLNGVELPQDEQGIYYITQDMASEEWNGFLSFADGWELYATAQTREQMQDKASLIASGTAVEFVGVREGSLCTVRAVFCGLPVMAWYTDPARGGVKEDGRQLWYGRMDLFETDGRVKSCSIRYNLRGSYSMEYEKKGYKLNLIDGAENPLHLSLAGMRKDDDWQLRALYTDPQKVRESAAVNLWNQLAAGSAFNYPTGNMEYVELIVDGEYLGLYALTERLDDKQVNAGGSDILYKNGLDTKAEYDFESAAQQGIWPQELEQSGHLGAVKIYGNGLNLPQPWQPYRQLMDLLYEEESDPTYEELTALLNVDNAIDWGLFKQALGLYDNDLHNLYWLARAEGDRYRIYYIPYDMDLSFGHFPEGLTEEPFGILDWAAGRLFDTPALTALLETNPEEMAPRVNQRWAELRAGVLSNANITGLLTDALEQVVQSGAFARDSARWPGEYNDADLQPTLDWMQTRLAVLDEYYGPAGWTAP